MEEYPGVNNFFGTKNIILLSRVIYEINSYA